jgi:hypothetical protein
MMTRSTPTWAIAGPISFGLQFKRRMHVITVENGTTNQRNRNHQPVDAAGGLQSV